MAKSLRSKWKRKMRAEKRVKYGAKERVRLLNMLDDAKAAEAEPIVRLKRKIRTKEDPTGEGILIKFSHLCVSRTFQCVSHDL